MSVLAFLIGIPLAVELFAAVAGVYDRRGHPPALPGALYRLAQRLAALALVLWLLPFAAWTALAIAAGVVAGFTLAPKLAAPLLARWPRARSRAYHGDDGYLD